MKKHHPPKTALVYSSYIFDRQQGHLWWLLPGDIDNPVNRPLSLLLACCAKETKIDPYEDPTRWTADQKALTCTACKNHHLQHQLFHNEA